MKILYDYQAFSEVKVSGISRCFAELIGNMPSTEQVEVAIKESCNLYLKELNIVKNLRNDALNKYSFLQGVPLSSLWKSRIYRRVKMLYPFIKTADYINRKYAIELIRNGDYDFFHSTNLEDYFIPYIGAKPWTFTIHDMTAEICYAPNGYQAIQKKKLSKLASCVIAVSDNTKKDIVNILNIPEEKVFVVKHGAPQKIEMVGDRLIKEDYFLYVGMRNGYKNFKKTLEDFANFKYKNVRLVCTWEEFNEEEMRLIHNYKLDNRVVHVFASETELANLYSYAVAFVYPSIYEGFGLPILEAFTYNCPCLLNNASCFPEIGGDGALYFESDGIKSNLTEMMEYVYLMSDLEKQNLITSAKKQLSKYSWSNASMELLKVYKTMI